MQENILAIKGTRINQDIQCMDVFVNTYILSLVVKKIL